MYISIIKIITPFILVLSLILPVINLTFFVKPNKKILIIYSLIFYILFYYTCNTNYPYIDFLIPIAYFLCLLIVYKKVLISIILAGFIWILSSLSDSITGVILIYILKYDYSDINANPILDLLSEILIFLITFILSKLIRLVLLKVFNKINLNLKIPKKFKFTFLISILIIIFVIYQAQTSFYSSEQTWNESMVLINVLYLFIFFISAVAIIYYSFAIMNMVNMQNTKEYLQLKDYTNMIENMYSDLRSFKHDYLNILSTLETYIEKDDLKGLKCFYYEDLLPESNEIMNKDVSLSLLSHIKISPLKALLSSKIINAHSQDIDVKIEILDDIEVIHMSTIDICRIVGILLDNAIEASILCDYKFIHFAAIKTDNEIIFILTNSCLSSTPPIHKLYQKNFSTKGEGRGIGLNNIKDIINKNYKNVLFNTTLENCIFNQELIIRNK